MCICVSISLFAFITLLPSRLHYLIESYISKENVNITPFFPSPSHKSSK